MQKDQYLGKNLIFIISPPRSGSTLLQRIIGAHSDIFTVAEPWIMLHPIYSMRQNGFTAEYNAHWAKVGLVDFLNNFKSKKVWLDAVRAYADTLYTGILKEKNKIFFLDKTPRYYFVINELIDLFPEARFIFLKRNPLAILASIFNTWIKKDYNNLLKNKHDLTKSIYNIENINSKPPCFVNVHYEHLVQNPKNTIIEICNKINIKFESNMLDYAKTPVPSGFMGDPHNAKKLTSVTSDFVNRWKDILQSDPVYWFIANFFLDHLGSDLVHKWGYSYETIRNDLNSRIYKLSKDDKKICFQIIKELRDPLDYTK